MVEFDKFLKQLSSQGGNICLKVVSMLDLSFTN